MADAHMPPGDVAEARKRAKGNPEPLRHSISDYSTDEEDRLFALSSPVFSTAPKPKPKQTKPRVRPKKTNTRPDAGEPKKKTYVAPAHRLLFETKPPAPISKPEAQPEPAAPETESDSGMMTLTDLLKNRPSAHRHGDMVTYYDSTQGRAQTGVIRHIGRVAAEQASDEEPMLGDNWQVETGGETLNVEATRATDGKVALEYDPLKEVKRLQRVVSQATDKQARIPAKIRATNNVVGGAPLVSTTIGRRITQGGARAPKRLVRPPRKTPSTLAQLQEACGAAHDAIDIMQRILQQLVEHSPHSGAGTQGVV